MISYWENGADTWPVGDVICACTEICKLATEYIQQALRGGVIEALYFVVSKIKDLLNARIVIHYFRPPDRQRGLH